MPRIARAHHFVPEGMLAGFTKTGSKDDKLWTIDLVRKREWPSTPKNVGHRRDLYRVDVEGIPPDFIEQKLLAPVDGCAVAVIREIERRSSLPSDPSAMEILFLFIALQMTRVPLTRFAVNEIIDQLHRDQISKSLQSREAWAKTLAEMQNMGIDTTGMEYSEMCQVLPRVRYQGTQHFHMRVMLEGALDYAPLLRARNWGISVSTSASFICSDRPVILAFTTPPPWSSYPGLALPNTDVFVPLTKHLLLRGSWAAPVSVGRMSRKGIARFNSLLMHNAERFLFASTTEFPWLDWRGQRSEVRHGTAALPRKGDKPLLYRIKD